MSNRSQFYRASFGTVRMWCSKITTERARTIVVHEPARGDEHVVVDRGAGLVVMRGTLLFPHIPGDTLSPKDRLEEFRGLADGKAKILTHPTSGSYEAYLGTFTEDIDDSGNLTAEVEFMAAGAVRDAIPAGASAIPASGQGLVDAAADAFSAELDEVGEDNLDYVGLGDDAKAAADAWVANPDVSQRDVTAQMGLLSGRLGSAASEYTSTLDKWQLFKSTVELASALRDAADTVSADTARTFVMMIGSSAPLRAIIADEYGADEADRRLRQAMDLNNLATPGLLTPGTRLRLPSKTPRARNG